MREVEATNQLLFYEEVLSDEILVRGGRNALTAENSILPRSYVPSPAMLEYQRQTLFNALAEQEAFQTQESLFCDELMDGSEDMSGFIPETVRVESSFRSPSHTMATETITMSSLTDRQLLAVNVMGKNGLLSVAPEHERLGNPPVSDIIVYSEMVCKIITLSFFY